MMECLVRINGVRKSFAATRAVDGLTLAVKKGELFGLIGPDGAGKTTLLRMLVTLLHPDEGAITVQGFDAVRNARSIRSIVGYMPQRFSLYPDLSIDQNLRFFADLFGVPASEIEERKARLYRFSRLEQFADRLAGKLSGGMKQKLALSCTLIHDPVLLVLDEPTTGVDPVSRTEFWAILRELREQGVTIVVSTPYMDEALLCDSVIIMHQGKALASGAPRDLINQYPYPMYSLPHSKAGSASGELEGIDGVISVQSFGDTLHITVREDISETVLSAAVQQRLGTSTAIQRIEASFEDVFIRYILEGAHDGQ